MKNLTNFFIKIENTLASLLSLVDSRRTLLLTKATSNRSRAAGLVEYMLLGALAVFLFLLIRAVLGGSFSSILDRIKSALSL
jgi:hypothetical protein